MSKYFQGTGLLIDLENAEVAVGFSVDTLREQGYPVDTWARTHLLLDRGLVEFEAMTPDGLMRCSLDTGSIWNVLNRGVEGKSIVETCSDPNCFIEYSSFTVGETNIGSIVFRQIPINLPIPVPLTLGVDFFLQHQVFIDFKEKRIYFSPAAIHPT